MSEKSQLTDKLKRSKESRAAYTRAKLRVNIPSQVRALRRRREMTQTQLAVEAGMKQSRISAIERPGAINLNVETLTRLAAAFKVGLVVKFASFSEMLDWENSFSQDVFDPPGIDDDINFLTERVSRTNYRLRSPRTTTQVIPTTAAQIITGTSSANYGSAIAEVSVPFELQRVFNLKTPDETLWCLAINRTVRNLGSGNLQSTASMPLASNRQEPRA